jgi:hypothetical protein
VSHIVECWAHSVIAFESISHAPIHGVFTNKMSDFKFDGVMR